MSHPLETRIGALRLHVRELLAAYGLGRWLACAIGVVVLGALADYLVRFRDPGIRVLATLCVSAVMAWAAYRYIYLPWTARLCDVDLARRVQMRFPSLGDDLASAVEFLGQADDDPTAGSLELRRAVVARAADAAAGLDFRRTVHAGPTWLAGLGAAVAALLAAMLALADPTSAQIALARLAKPLAEIPWPQVHHLAIRNPVERIARGQAFEVEVVDAQGTRLPAEARIFYRFENSEGATSEESEPMRLVHGMMVARRERVTRPFSFRVEGGDDRSMPWQPVKVVDPPGIAALRVTLTPPAYAGWPVEHSEGNIRALAGTRASIVASATKPLAAALLRLDRGMALPARLSNDGLQIAVPEDSGSSWILEKSGSYALQLIDLEWVSNGADVRWEIRVVPDAPPSVTLEEPSAGADLFVTAEAHMPLAASASDDLAIQRIDLQFTRSDRAADPPAKRSLYAGPSRPQTSEVSKTSEVFGHGTADRRTVRAIWKLDELKLAPGAQVAFWIEAADYKPQTAKSEVRRLSIITKEELAQRLISREAAILGELSRALALERRGREQVAALEKRAAESPRLEQLDVDRLRGAELNQRQIEQSLSSRREGIPSQILSFLADLANNKLDQPRMRQRMEKILAGLEDLAANELPGAGRELTAAIKAAQALLDHRDSKLPPTSLRTPMAEAGKHQDAIIAALEQMTDELSQSNRFREFSRDLGQLAREQDELAARTGELARRTLAKQLEDLTPQEAAELAEAARQQAEIAGRFDAIEQAMDQALKQASPDDPAAANVSEGLRRARDLSLAGQMRSAGAQIRGNQLGQAVQQQGRVQEALREIADLVAGRQPRKPAEQPTAQAEQSLEEIKRMQEEINRRTQELERSFKPAARSSPEARRRYEALGRDQTKLGEMLRRLFALPPSEEPKP